MIMVVYLPLQTTRWIYKLVLGLGSGSTARVDVDNQHYSYETDHFYYDMQLTHF